MRDRLTTLGTTLLLLAGSICLVACDEPRPRQHPINVHYSQCLSLYEDQARPMDLLLVVDDSIAMAGFQERLAANLPALTAGLRHMVGGMPDLHLGVVTTVLGTGTTPVPGCPQTGHEGRMRTATCAYPVGATYFKDVAPSGCVFTRDVYSTCTSHTCVAENCEHAPGTWLDIDPDTGCPRCRNYEGSLDTVIGCVGEGTVKDCPFSQPLAAMRLALESEHNSGFRREDAKLGIVFITAADDCSAADPRLFAPEDSGLGPRTGFRCFEHGVTCDTGGREPGPRQSCHPPNATDGLLARVETYIAYLQTIIDPQLLMVSAVLGPFDEPDTLMVQLDSQGQAQLAPSCSVDATMSATPGVRLHNFLAAFNGEMDLDQWAKTSICHADYTPALAGLGHRISVTLLPTCFELPLRGCSDPAEAEGLPGDGEPCNDACVPRCFVTEVQQRGLPEETQTNLPHCLEVCVDGPCPGNTDPTLAYADGRPVERDYRLPVEACWTMRDSTLCQYGSTPVVARRADPPPRSFVSFCCELAPEVEQVCDDGVDNSEN